MTNICDYGCGNIAIYFKKRVKKWCCSESHNSCPAVIQRGKKDKKYYAKRAKLSVAAKKKNINKDGLNSYQVAAIKTKQIRFGNINKDGLNSYQVAAIKMNNTKKTTIINGKTIEEWSIIKQCKTKIKYNLYEQAGKKMSEHLNSIDLLTNKRYADLYVERAVKTKHKKDKNGLTIHQKAAKKSIQTKINTIDENGINLLEKSLMKSKISGLKIHHYENTDIIYQGSYEKIFLDSLKNIHGLQWVVLNITRGNPFKYIGHDNHEHIYLPDYCINDKYFEIKSKWTWDNHNTNEILLYDNRQKLKSVNASGYNITLILDHVSYTFEESMVL